MLAGQVSSRDSLTCVPRSGERKESQVPKFSVNRLGSESREATRLYFYIFCVSFLLDSFIRERHARCQWLGRCDSVAASVRRSAMYLKTMEKLHLWLLWLQPSRIVSHTGGPDRV